MSGSEGIRQRKHSKVDEDEGKEGEGRGYWALGVGQRGERKKWERERPTDRRMRPTEVFNWEEGLGFCFLGRGLSINTWAAKCYPARSLSSLYKMCLFLVFPPALPFVVYLVALRARH